MIAAQTYTNNADGHNFLFCFTVVTHEISGRGEPKLLTILCSYVVDQVCLLCVLVKSWRKNVVFKFCISMY